MQFQGPIRLILRSKIKQSKHAHNVSFFALNVKSVTSSDVDLYICRCLKAVDTNANQSPLTGD